MIFQVPLAPKDSVCPKSLPVWQNNNKSYYYYYNYYYYSYLWFSLMIPKILLARQILLKFFFKNTVIGPTQVKQGCWPPAPSSARRGRIWYGGFVSVSFSTELLNFPHSRARQKRPLPFSVVKNFSLFLSHCGMTCFLFQVPWAFCTIIPLTSFSLVWFLVSHPIYLCSTSPLEPGKQRLGHLCSPASLPAFPPSPRTWSTFNIHGRIKLLDPMDFITVG